MDSAVTQTIESYLCHYGWAFRPVNHGQWQTGWQGSKRYFPLGLTVCDSWVTMTIKPFVIWHEGWDCARELASYLLKLNNLCPMVKLAMDEKGEICLSLSLLSENLEYQDFSNAIGILGYYAESLYEEIQERILLLEGRDTTPLGFLT